MEFSFITLGTASALPTAYRYPSAHVVTYRERLFLIDCGEGAQMQMRKAGIPFSKIDNIFISHMHGDHVFGIFGLLSTFGMINRHQPLYIYAPFAFKKTLDFFMSEYGEGVKYEIVFVPINCSEPTVIYENKKFEILSFPLRHRCDTFGYIFREKLPPRNIHKHLITPYNLSLQEIGMLKNGEDVVRDNGIILNNSYFTYLPYYPRQFAYCSDTMPYSKLPDFIKNSDLLYHEATFGSELADMAKTTFHSTAAQAAKNAILSGSKKLIIGHFSSRYKTPDNLLMEAKEVFENTELAVEGKKFEIPLKLNKDE